MLSDSTSIPSSIVWLGLRLRLFIIFVIALMRLSAASVTEPSGFAVFRSMVVSWVVVCIPHGLKVGNWDGSESLIVVPY